MNICFLAHAASIHTRHWMRYFRDLGHQVSIVSFTPAVAEPGIALHYIPQSRESSIERTNWHYLRSLPRMRQIVNQIEPDILNAHFLSSYGFMGALIRPASCPLVISLHGSDILLIPKRTPVHQWAAHFALRRADLITSVAEHMTKVVRPIVGDAKPIVTLQYGVKTDFFHPPEKHQERSPIILSNRRLVPLANIETILAAARLLQERGSSLRLVVAGNGILRDQLELMSSDVVAAGRITFIGEIDQKRMADNLRQAALYVSMTRSDGASLSLLEAMACGCFPIVSDIPANRDWIEHGSNGYLVPLEDVSSLADHLARAWENPSLREGAAKVNWHLVQEKGEYQKNMAALEAIFIDLQNTR